MHPSTESARLEALVTTMSEQISRITRTLGSWVQQEPHDLDLQQLEQQVLQLVKELGASLVAGLCSLLAPTQPSRTRPCPCGQTARYQRQRPAKVTTILGPITIQRPYYLCPSCGQGEHPLDDQLQFCAGSRSAGLDELLALLGATQDSFAEAASVLERLTLVHVSPNSVRDATEALGAELVAHQAQAIARTMDGHDDGAAVTPGPPRLYITMDGVLAHLHERGWSELKVGCCYQTRTRTTRTRPETLEIHAHSTTYVTGLVEAQTFGWHLWQEAARQGVATDEVVVVGDGAHWIWNIADMHFPQATQIVDWYHASEYVWAAASTIWGEEHPDRAGWAHQQLDALWESKVEQVLAALEQHRAAGAGVTAALSYYTTHRERMDYASYRARGLQIGSGNVESACKQLVSARLKQAGMIWDGEGAERVAVVRAWLKSERWQEAMTHRAAPGRRYQRQHPRVKPTNVPLTAEMSP
ncbi:MAG: ISKra4 family transposase, partial [Chloroflexi bacterium]|nr:ISKra4 family transposase [Chloroflexota bacterium]